MTGLHFYDGMATAARSADGRSRVLSILHVLAPAEFGGLERVVHALATGQRDRGYAVSVFAVVDQGRERDHPIVLDLRAERIDVRPIVVPPRAYRVERRALADLLRRERPDIVHTHGARVDVLDAPVALRAGVPTVTTVHGFTGGDLRNRVYEHLQRRAIRRASRVVAVSARLGDQLVSAGIAADRLRVIPNAWCGEDAFLNRDDARLRLGLRDVSGPVVGWIGRLTREKGADVFLEAVARLDVPAVIVGSGPELAALRRRADQLGVSSRVHFAGQVEHAGRCLRALDILAISSRTEGTPIVLLEAMAARVPLVATEVGGIPAVVRPAECVLVPPDQPGALAEAMRRLLDDPVAARRRATAALERLSAFGREPWLDRYHEVYRSLVGTTSAVDRR